MVTAKTKTPTDPAETAEPVDEPAGTPSDDETFAARVTAIVRELLKKEPTIADDSEPDEGEPAKRPSPRDEEARMHKIASDAVAEFKKSLGDEGDDDKPKSEPEKIPLSSAVRKIEKWLWGVE